jgi:hypothetical protein
MQVVEVQCPQEYETIFSEDAVTFLAAIVRQFDSAVDALMRRRETIRLDLKGTGRLPAFATSTARSDPGWKIAPLPRRAQNCQLTIGDTSPAQTERFRDCMDADVQAVQVQQLLNLHEGRGY